METYNNFFLNDDIHTLYKNKISEIEIEVDTQNNRIQIPGTMRTGLTWIQSHPHTQFPNTVGVGGKKKTRKHKKNKKQKTKKHKKNNTYKKK